MQLSDVYIERFTPELFLIEVDKMICAWPVDDEGNDMVKTRKHFQDVCTYHNLIEMLKEHKLFSELDLDENE